MLAAGALAACASKEDAARKDASRAQAGETGRDDPRSADGQVTIASDQPGRAAPPAPMPLDLREMFPGVRADVRQRAVEFDARTSPLLVADPQAPNFYIETIVCLPDTREHESLLVVEPSHLHAALSRQALRPVR